MVRTFSLATTLVFAGMAVAAAQTVTTTTTVTSSAPAVAASTPVAPPPVDPDDFTRSPGDVASDPRGRLLIGAPLDPTYRDSEPLSDGLNTLFVIDDNNLKDAGTWTAEDRAACEADGGVELPLPAGRIACFRL